MRSYTVSAVAHAIDADVKWLDNLLSHHDLTAVAHTDRGVPRQIGLRGAMTAAIVARLVNNASLPVRVAVSVARRALSQDGHADIASVRLAEGIDLTIDLGELRRTIEARLAEAVETVASPRRGRPPTHRRLTDAASE